MSAAASCGSCAIGTSLTTDVVDRSLNVSRTNSFAPSATVAVKSGEDGDETVYVNPAGGEVKHPKDGRVMAPVVPVGYVSKSAPTTNRREMLATWLTSPENPFFARSMANRLWSYFLGRGIIDPVDDIRASNPASNPELLDALTAEFVSSGFDVRKLMRTICQSRTYQLSIVKNKWNEDDTVNFSHANPAAVEHSGDSPKR